MAKIHDLFIVELAEVIKGYGNNPDYEDPFRLSEFYRFYELPNIAVSRENFEKMRPAESERKKGKWQWCGNHHLCSECDEWALTKWDEDECDEVDVLTDFCPSCGADMREGEEE